MWFAVSCVFVPCHFSWLWLDIKARPKESKTSVNHGSLLLLDLLGSVALVLWSVRLANTGIQRAFGNKLRDLLQIASGNRFVACCLGIVAAMILQSSTATGLLLISLVSRDLMNLLPALAMMLGADIGSTLVVQFLSFDLKAIVPVLFSVGVGAFMLSPNATVRQVGRIIIGLALMIVGLGMIVSASVHMRESGSLAYVLSLLSDEPFFAVLLAALLTWMMHSSVAMVLLIATLAGTQVISVPLALVLLLGANMGAGMILLGLGWRNSWKARYLILGNLLFRVSTGFIIMILMVPFLSQVSQLSLPPAQLIALAHMVFNIIVAIIFLPWIETALGILSRIMPAEAQTNSNNNNAPLHLDEALFPQPSLALGAAAREVFRLAERVEAMLSQVMHTFSDGDDRRIRIIRGIDDEVDHLQESIKLYLTRLTREPLSAEEARRAVDLILFTTNLEHVGDIIDKSLLLLASKRQRNAVSFSDAGWAELTEFHARVLRQMKLAMAVFMTQDVDMARDLISEKDSVRLAEKSATERHLARLRDGTAASIETSGLHLDVLRDLKHINGHIVSIAHPILEATGEIRTSRLRQAVIRSDPKITTS